MFLLISCQVQAPGDKLAPVDEELINQDSIPLSVIETPEQAINHIPQNSYPTLADFWESRADLLVEVTDTDLPMGESDTVVRENGVFWSYVHASQDSIGTVDQCGDPVPFPGCTVIFRSDDAGASFRHDDPPICQFACQSCPCVPEVDHIDQQQYPRVIETGEGWVLVYEYRARIMMRRSIDGLNWSDPKLVAGTGFHDKWLGRCLPNEIIGEHPFASHEFDCLAGAPPGLFVEGYDLYILTALGQNPGAISCFYGPLKGAAGDFRPCRSNPLLTGAEEYGPLEAEGDAANPYFDFRTLSAAEVVKVGEGETARYYMFYEGIRGPGPSDPGDSQFGLGLARSLTSHIDGPWEKYAGNPILVDLPGNVGLGHADYVFYNDQTLLYTSIDGRNRSRLALEWN